MQKNPATSIAGTNPFTFISASSVAICLFAQSATVLAHHSAQAIYDTATRDFEVAGEITEVRWRNPHIRIMVRVATEDGKTEDWRLELSDPGSLATLGLTADLFNVGDFIRATGSPGRRGQKIMFGGTNIVLPDGRVVADREIVGDAPGGPAGGVDYGDAPLPWFAEVKPRTDGRTDIFTTWIAPPIFDNNVEAGVWGGDIQLTAQGAALRDAFDPAGDDNPFLSCTRGVPEIMTGFGPMDFIDEGNRILLRFEEFDTYRPIMMGADAEANRPPKSEVGPYGDVGYAAGYWEDKNTLVVRTTGMNFPYYDQSGLAQRPESAEIVERWTLINDGHQLHYELTVIDPEIFVEPVVQTKTWAWSAERRVQPYNCDPTQEQ